MISGTCFGLMTEDQVRGSSAGRRDVKGAGSSGVEFTGGWLETLLIQEGIGAGGVGHYLLGLEPQTDLMLGVLQGVAAVDDVPEKQQEGQWDHRQRQWWLCVISYIIACI